MAALSIIIPHLNDRARLWRCLNALALQLAPDVEVIVCDNGSDESLGGIEIDFPWAVIVHEARRGAGPARNAGVHVAKGDVLAFLDSDCRPAPDWVAQIKGMSLSQKIVAGCVETFDETTAAATPAQLFERVFAFDNARYVRELGFGVTANLITTRAVFEEVGPFRSGVPEDLDWCVRARSLDMQLVYDAALVVRHPTRADWAALCTKYRRVEQERFALSGGVGATWLMRLVLTAISPFRDMFRVIWSPKLGGIRERVFCLAALFRLRLARVGWMWQMARRGGNSKSGHPSKLSPGRHL